jgi:hypothetical protein
MKDKDAPRITVANFMGFEHGNFYARYSGSLPSAVRVRTYQKPVSAVTFFAESVGRCPGMKARTTEGDVPLLNGEGKPLPGAAEAVRCLMNPDEAALVALFRGAGQARAGDDPGGAPEERPQGRPQPEHRRSRRHPTGSGRCWLLFRC